MQSVRIIGGTWRSRRLEFPELPGLRPTQDRIRETLFNWLMPFVNNATCLDLFAGSGALGFEALSRGARFSCFVDSHRRVLTALHANAQKLAISPDRFAITMGGATCKHLPSLPQAPFDIVFLDPPFHQGLLAAANDWLLNSGSLKAGALIYMEMEKDLQLTLPDGWEIFRQQTTSSLIFQLVRVIV